MKIAIKIFDWIVDILMPKSGHVKFLENLGPIGISERLEKSKDIENEKLTSVFSYKSPFCKNIIWEIKYRGNKKLIRDMSKLLYEHILEEIMDMQTFSNFRNPILVPIPCSNKRLREKGFNQCVLICKELDKLNQLSGGKTFQFIDDLLVKKDETEHQSKTKGRRQRLENLKNCFSVDKKYTEKDAVNNVQGRCVIVVDDVITTGATMNEAFRALKDSGVRKYIGVSLAH